MKFFLILSMLISAISCKDETNYKFDKNYIKELSKSSPGNEIFYNADILFVKTENEKYGVTNIAHLFTIYEIKYNQKFKDFESFLLQALNQKIFFDEDLFNGRDISVFIIDKKMQNEFQPQNISFLLNKYFKKTGKEFEFNCKELSDNSFYTLMYYFFMNDYTVIFDDYTGLYFVKPKLKS